MTATVFTTAPEGYDGFSTRTVNARAGTDNRGQIIRVVQMDETDFSWQTGRYMSGLYAAYGEVEANEMFESGLWTKNKATEGTGTIDYKQIEDLALQVADRAEEIFFGSRGITIADLSEALARLVTEVEKVTHKEATV